MRQSGGRTGSRERQAAARPGYRRAACIRSRRFSLRPFFVSGLDGATKQRGGRSRLFTFRKLLGLESANVLCLPAFLSLGHSEFNRLAVLQAAVSVRLNGGEMHEDIFSVLA